MFSHSNKTAEPPSSQPVNEVRPAGRVSGEPSVISADLKIIGDLHSAGEIQVRGTVEGDIKSRSVTIGEGANVQGSISAEKVLISGAIKGQVEAPSVTVAKTAKVVGDIVHETLSVEAGAFMEGNCRRIDTRKSVEPTGFAPLKTSLNADGEKKKAVGGI